MHKRNGLPPMLLFVALCGAVFIGCLAFYPWSSDQPTGRVDANDGDPYYFVPAPTPEPVGQFVLSLDLPELDADQAYWLKKARVVASCPLCVAVDQPPIPTLADNPNNYTVWLALIYTESRYQPWAVSEIGCYGLGQLCGALQSPDTDASPELNLYVSAQEFARLLDANHGDVMETIRNYKGVTTWDTHDQANSVWSYIRVGQ